MKDIRVGFALCGSFCTHRQVLSELEKLCGQYRQITPILSETCRRTDTRFGTAADLVAAVERLTGRAVIDSIPAAEPIGPKALLDVLVIAPCTGNTLARLAGGVTDTAVTMAAKAHLRNGRPVVICLASNDALAGSAKNIGVLLDKKNVYFVPFGQDDPEGKPTSLVADFTKVNDAVDAALQGRQLQPLLLQGRGS